METEDFKKILAENKAHFIERIRKERGISHLRYVCEYDYSEFPFLPEEYYEQKWFESCFDFFVREYLINDSLKEALDSDYGFDNIIVWPPRKSSGLVTGYNNHEFEKDHPIEFYIEGDEGKIGFRYTGMPYDEDKFESCFFADDSEYCLEQLVILSFEGFASHYGKYNIIGMSFESFFDAYFNSEMYQLFYEMVSGSIKEAKDIIAIKTIPQMTSKYLTTYRFVVEKRFRNSEADNYYVYNENLYGRPQRIAPTLNARSRTLYHNVISSDNYDKYFTSIIGDADFAKSFLTAEYMFDVIDRNNLLDFTCVIAGYLKCIEQLLARIMSSYSGMVYSERTLDDLIYTLKNTQDPNIMKAHIDRADRATIIDCLEIYKIECRNNHFHKHLILSWDDVRIIRNNTIYLCKIILNSFNWDTNNEDVLQIKDYRFDRVCSHLLSSIYRSVYIKNKDDTFSQLRLINYEDLETGFSLSGNFTGITLIFRKDKLNETYLIDKENLPSALFYSEWDDETNKTRMIRIY